MPKKFSVYWYKEGPEFTQAFLYNLRDNDVQEDGQIAKGAIVHGAVGFVAAESEVFGWTGKTMWSWRGSSAKGRGGARL